MGEKIEKTLCTHTHAHIPTMLDNKKNPGGKQNGEEERKVWGMRTLSFHFDNQKKIKLVREFVINYGWI